MTASVDRATAYIGDLIGYQVTITYDSTLQLMPPAIGANLGGFDVRDYKVGEEEKLKEGKRKQVFKFQISTFTTGDYVIPGMPIEYRSPGDSLPRFISVDPIKITIKSLLADTTAVDTLKPRPPKEQASLGRDYTLIIIISALVLATIGIGVYIIIRRRMRLKELVPFIDPRPAWEIAFAELAMLKEKNLVTQGEIKPYYFELSEILRKYIGRKFEFNALDLTTEEIGEVIMAIPFGDGIQNDIAAFMNHADLVKFAKFVPTPERPDIDWQTACELVTKTKDFVIAPEPTPSPPSEPVPVTTLSEEMTELNDELKYAPPELRRTKSNPSQEDQS